MEKVSIIIPCKSIDSLTKECIDHCLKLDYDNFEIIVLPDSFKNELKKNKKIKVIKTGNVKPAVKRNIGMKKARGKFFASIDSDAYPEKNWLKNAIPYFKDKKIGIVGGPNLTPPKANFWERISGYTLSNFFISGEANIRYKISKNKFTVELPSCNYISRKEASSEYDSGFLTAEDSQFCFKCAEKGYKVLYANDVIVYHHRRDSFEKHIKQLFIYGRDIAWLTKKDFSFDKVYYSILSLALVGFFLLSALSIFNDLIRVIFLALLSIYSILMLITSVHEDVKTSFWTVIMSIGTQISYGMGWMWGILSRPNAQ